MNNIISLKKAKKDHADFITVLNKLMAVTNTTMSQLGKNTGLSHTTIKRMCTDPASNPTLTSITKLAEFFGVTPNQLIGSEPIENEAAAYYPDFENWSKVPVLKLPDLLDWPTNIKSIVGNIDTQYVMTDIDANENTFATVSADESLEPKFPSGTILIFNPGLAPKNKNLVLLLMSGKELPQFRQILIDGPDIYEKVINSELKGGIPSLLEKGSYRILGTLIQAKSNYI